MIHPRRGTFSLETNFSIEPVIQGAAESRSGLTGLRASGESAMSVHSFARVSGNCKLREKRSTITSMVPKLPSQNPPGALNSSVF